MQDRASAVSTDHQGAEGVRVDAGRAGDGNVLVQASEFSGGDYNLLPYPSMPFAYTQPGHLAALTALFGFAAPAPDRARVLELGCASGGNIIPLAARWPNAHFLGIDLTKRHVEHGLQRIAALGLPNIEIRQSDLAQISFGHEQFDYVICHGVFSWVPKAAQAGILRICSENLAPNGVATISYNVLPGWHMRRIVRDICLHHVGKEGPARQRVTKARWALDQIAKSVSETEPYGLLLRNEARRMARRPASYILGEFLVADNTPCYFHEFVAHAEQYGLTYLCEGDLNASIPQILNPETRRRNRALAGSNPLALEQYIDFFTGRTFRRSVLVRTQQAACVERTRRPERLRPLHFASRLRFDPSHGNANLSIYRDDQGRAITTKDPVVCRALARLAEFYPTTLTLKQLTAPSAEKETMDRGNVETRVCKALFRLVAAGQATVSALPLQAGSATAERPRVWPVARVEAEARQPWITSLHHVAVPLHPIAAVMLAHLDGSNDRQMLKARLIEALRCGEVRVVELQAESGQIEHAQLETVAAQYVERTLSHLALHAILEPTSS